MDEISKKALETFIAGAAGAKTAEIQALRLLSGGSIQENWLVDLALDGGVYDGQLQAVVRCDSASEVAVSHGRPQEFALLKAAFDAGVTVPEPLWLCDDVSVIGRPFFVMRRIMGTAASHLMVKDGRYGGDRKVLTQRLGAELARIHSVCPPQLALDFLPWYEEAPALRWVRQYRDYLDAHATPHPALEWGLCWLERHAPPRGDITLTHGDFRTGNYMADEHGLTGVLDWEFAGWGDPMQDLGWLCAKCWRFGRYELEVGGIGQREDLYQGYEAVARKSIDRDVVRYWEVMATMKWAIITLQQAERHVSGKEESLLLALTAHITPELELEILNMTEID